MRLIVLPALATSLTAAGRRGRRSRFLYAERRLAVLPEGVGR
jgi:hypothetical protein